jgi:hypothetical protein
MRGTILRAAPVCLVVLATGCFMLGNRQPDAGPPRSETHAYWQKAGEILARPPATQDMKGMLRLVGEQAAALGALPTEGVDADLVAAVQDVVKCEQEVLERAELADNSEEVLRQSKELAKLFADANKKAAESKKHLRALREALNARHGGGFAAMPAPGGAPGGSGAVPNNRKGW